MLDLWAPQPVTESKLTTLRQNLVSVTWMCDLFLSVTTHKLVSKVRIQAYPFCPFFSQVGHFANSHPLTSCPLLYGSNHPGRLKGSPSKTCEASYIFSNWLMIIHHQRAAEHTQTMVITALFRIHEHTDVSNLVVVALIDSGESNIISPTRFAFLATDGCGIFKIQTHGLPMIG